MSTKDFAPGGYRYVPGVFQYSAGVAALPGHVIERVCFANPVPLKEGFARIAQIIGAAGRPLTSFCACAIASRGKEKRAVSVISLIPISSS